MNAPAKSSRKSYEAYASAKGNNRIQINNILSAVCIGALSVLLAISSDRLSPGAVGQLAIAIPCLVTSSLSYSKITYRREEEHAIWDWLGWVTHSIGYALIINALAIMAYNSNYSGIAWLFLGVNTVLFTTYSIVDVAAKSNRLVEKVWKLVFYISLLIAGSVIPIAFGMA
jgi:small-conductance mechanosensitive channel